MIKKLCVTTFFVPLLMGASLQAMNYRQAVSAGKKLLADTNPKAVEALETCLRKASREGLVSVSAEKWKQIVAETSAQYIQNKEEREAVLAALKASAAEQAVKNCAAQASSSSEITAEQLENMSESQRAQYLTQIAYQGPKNNRIHKLENSVIQEFPNIKQPAVEQQDDAATCGQRSVAYAKAIDVLHEGGNFKFLTGDIEDLATFHKRDMEQRELYADELVAWAKKKDLHTVFIVGPVENQIVSFDFDNPLSNAATVLKEYGRVHFICNNSIGGQTSNHWVVFSVIGEPNDISNFIYIDPKNGTLTPENRIWKTIKELKNKVLKV